MIYRKRNFILAYLLLVILPLLGLTRVLKSGNSLTAPIAVGGQWKIQLDTESLAALPCGKSLLVLLDPGFTISQSGKTFTLNFANPAMFSASGTIEGTSIKASLTPPLPGWAKEAGCDGAGALSLSASVNSEASGSSLVGAFSVTDCPECARVGFRALRKDQSQGKEGR